LFAARRRARSARATNAGAFAVLGGWPFFFIHQSSFARFQYHSGKKWRAVLPEGHG
jgi:hypothetical protein